VLGGIKEFYIYLYIKFYPSFLKVDISLHLMTHLLLVQPLAPVASGFEIESDRVGEAFPLGNRPHVNNVRLHNSK
jgi:hypothetical protein